MATIVEGPGNLLGMDALVSLKLEEINGGGGDGASVKTAVLDRSYVAQLFPGRIRL